MNTDNIKMKYDKRNVDIDFFYYRKEVPIEEVLDIYGIEVNKRGWFLCPAHNDTRPSAKLYPNDNRWECFSCHCGGTPLDLVSKMEGLDIRHSALFLSQYYPAGVKELSKPEDNRLTPPLLTAELRKKIGLNQNPFSTYNVRGQIGEDESGNKVSEQKELTLKYDEAASLVIDKLTAYINNQQDYLKDLLDKFPELDNKAVTYIKLVVAKEIEEVAVVLTSYRIYAKNLAEIISEFNQSPWDMQEEREA